MNKLKILVTRELTPEANKTIFKLKDHYDITWHRQATPIDKKLFMEMCKGQHGILCTLADKINYELLKECGSQLKVISTMSVGYEHFDLEAIKKFELENSIKIKLGFTPDVLTDAVAEINIGLALTVGRRLFEAQTAALKGEWKQWSPNWLLGTQLSNKTIGMLGFGRIAEATYQRLLPFKPSKILYHKRQPLNNINDYDKLEYVDIDTLLKESDILFINVDLNPSTTRMINYSLLNKMKSSAILINASRGTIINQEDLVKILRENKLGGVGLDVTIPEPLDKQHPLFTEFKNKVTIFPHIGSSTTETRDAMGQLAIDNLIDGLNSRELKCEIKRC